MLRRYSRYVQVSRFRTYRIVQIRGDSTTDDILYMSNPYNKFVDLQRKFLAFETRAISTGGAKSHLCGGEPCNTLSTQRRSFQTTGSKPSTPARYLVKQRANTASYRHQRTSQLLDECWWFTECWQGCCGVILKECNVNQKRAIGCGWKVHEESETRRRALHKQWMHQRYSRMVKILQ